MDEIELLACAGWGVGSLDTLVIHDLQMKN